MNVMTNTKCNHFFCVLGGKNKVATHKVEQTAPNGNVVVTYCCENDYLAFSKVIESPDSYCTYNVTVL